MRLTLSSVSLLFLLGCTKREPAPVRPEVLEARQLLKEAGYPDGKGFPKLTLLYNTAEHHKKIAAAVQEMWRVGLGVEFELVNTEWKVYLDRVEQSKFDVARRGWVGEYYDPIAFLGLFSTETRSRASGWSSEEFEKLLIEARSELDPAKRKKILAEAEEKLLSDAPAVPIFHYVAHNYVKSFVKGVHPNARDIHPLQGVTLEGEGAPEDGILLFNGGEDPGSIDPALSRDIGGLKILMHLYEGLVRYDPKDGSPIAGVAERWEASEDGMTWTFHLRKSKWSNGDPVTAADFLYAWRRVVDPKTGSAYADRMFVVRNGRKINRGDAAPETLGVRAPDDHTFVVELDHPAPWFLHLLCLNLFHPVHRATVEKFGERWSRAEHLVGNGPYLIDRWRDNDRKDFKHNPLYHSPDEVKLKRFAFLAMTDDSAAFRAYEAGQCHWLFRAPLEFMDELRIRGDYLPSPYNAVYFYVFNVNKKPLDDVRVRRALSLAIDREKIATAVLRGGETAADRFVPPPSRLK